MPRIPVRDEWLGLRVVPDSHTGSPGAIIEASPSPLLTCLPLRTAKPPESAHAGGNAAGGHCGGAAMNVS